MSDAPGRWDWANPVEVHGGVRLPDDLPALVDPGPALLVTSEGARLRGWTGPFEAALRGRCGEVLVWDRVRSNPSLDDLVAAESALAGFPVEQVVAAGGGSALDLAKAIAFVRAPGSPGARELVLRLRAGRPIPDVVALPWTAVPTTAGTGSEATPFATLWDRDAHRKLSLSHPSLFARRALLDPRLTLGLPWPVTLAGGLDALSQCLESVWNRRATPLTDALAASGAAGVLRSLPVVRDRPDALEARSDLQLSSLLSGLCISRTRTALAHSISYPLTARLGTPHGIACSFTLPALWEFSVEADDGRMAALARSLGLGPRDPSRELGRRLREFLDGLGFAAELRKTVPAADAVLALEGEMETPERAGNSLRPLGPGDLRGLLERSLASWGLR